MIAVRVVTYATAAFFGLFSCLAAPAAGEIRSLKVNGARILVNDKPTRLWGMRVASAAGREEYTKDLLENLEFYQARGINALVVYYQGSSGQTYKVFSPDGKSFEDAGIRDRMRAIIKAAAEKDMIVIIGLFCPRKMGLNGQDPRLASIDAYVEASRLVAAELKDFKNVIISVAHDPGATCFSAGSTRSPHRMPSHA